jgi:hypothetical protein
MQIIGDYYKLTPINEHSPKYDLELLHKIGGKNPREEFKIVAYGISLESAIERIILYAINQKLEEVSLKEFLEAYKEEVNKIRRELKESIA